MITTLTSKGQITLPKAIRDKLDLQTGDKVEFFVDDEGNITLMPVTASITKLKGMVPKPATPVSLDKMQKAIEKQGVSS